VHPESQPRRERDITRERPRLGCRVGEEQGMRLVIPACGLQPGFLQVSASVWHVLGEGIVELC
jgi:hypothetical protein